MLNLLSNAVKFSLDGGKVEVDLVVAARHVVVRVRDHGIGIPAAEVERLGTRFFRASNAVTNEIAGTGLGVRIVQTIVDKHAGEMRIDSEEGRGTTVSVRLPLHGDPDALEPSDRPAWQPAHPADDPAVDLGEEPEPAEASVGELPRN